MGLAHSSGCYGKFFLDDSFTPSNGVGNCGLPEILVVMLCEHRPECRYQSSPVQLLRDIRPISESEIDMVEDQ
jgi:hypothetical protein